MSSKKFRVLTTVWGAVLGFAGIASAQYVPRTVKVAVPFEFTAGEKSFPAGDYVLVCTPTSVDLRNARGQRLVALFHHSVQSQGMSPSTRLVFTTSAGGHDLQQIWLAGSNYGYELPASKTAVAFAKAHGDQRMQAGGSGTK